MKKWMSLIAATLFASAFLVGCGEKTEEGAGEAPAAGETKTDAPATTDAGATSSDTSDSEGK